VLEDRDVLDINGDHLLDLAVLHTPGHSPGSVSLLLKYEGLLFSSDAVQVTGDPPVYDDEQQSILSLQRLENIDGIGILLFSWDEPREGASAYQRIIAALDWLEEIYDAVLAAAGTGTPGPVELCRNVAIVLRLPPQSVTPLIVRTFMANLRARGRKDLFEK
jgi:glyoxylase-like metal-dependent hydrolase (beta-lactamase superfamily II)